MAVAVERTPIRWTYGTSPEPYAALLLAGRMGTTVTVNRRLVTNPWHAAVIEAWVAVHVNARCAVLPASALGIKLV